MEENQIHVGYYVDLKEKSISPSKITVKEGLVTQIEPAKEEECKIYLMPGFIDAHVHIESSLLIPSEFARMAVIHGTVGTISDPHEIANVMGIFGVEYMLSNASKVPFHFFFGAPSCVPATSFETAGDEINLAGVDYLLSRADIWYLAEVMNFPGVLSNDPELMGKIASAKKYGKPVDGHAPGLRGKDAKAYSNAGISTDHECFTLDEALDKLRAGMYIQIREGSAAKNFEALHPILKSHPEKTMFCSDDKHPDSLLEGHINLLVKRALSKGYDLFDVLRAASWNIKNHYNLPVGMLQVGDPADFIKVTNLETFDILETYISGKCVAREGKTLIHSVHAHVENRFKSREVKQSEFRIDTQENQLKVIEALEGQLITNAVLHHPKVDDSGNCISNVADDVLKIAVINRYEEAKPAVAFIKNIGIKHGAIASSVAHDSHNIVVVGCSDEEMTLAVNLLMKSKGGLCAVNKKEYHVLALPVAGLMSTDNGFEIAEHYIALDEYVKSKLGSHLKAPFMTLSFMALLVIPSLKLSDKGLFDGDHFRFTSIWGQKN